MNDQENIMSSSTNKTPPTSLMSINDNNLPSPSSTNSKEKIPVEQFNKMKNLKIDKRRIEYLTILMEDHEVDEVDAAELKQSLSSDEESSNDGDDEMSWLLHLVDPKNTVNDWEEDWDTDTESK
jgi:hypothetical protein